MTDTSSPPGAMSNYYSQQGEDFILDAFFGFRSNGFFVDVGAFDGIHLSNSYIFEQRGWSGICIEAAPLYFDLCVKNRPRTRCIHAACLAAERGPVPFRFERGGLFSGVHANADGVAKEFANRGLNFEGFENISVPSFPSMSKVRKSMCSMASIFSAINRAFFCWRRMAMGRRRPSTPIWRRAGISGRGLCAGIISMLATKPTFTVCATSRVPRI
jgi:hypothetical protein